jgi:transcriptional regulator
MYIAKSNRNENPEELRQFIQENGFGLLISQVEGKPWATHVPMVLSADGRKLTGHLARGNKQWKDFEKESDVLAVFSGPHAYVSSSWYDHENVPTWNYIAVHVSGKIKIVEGEELMESLKDLTNKYEKASACPVSVEKMSPEFLKVELRGIVAFEINIEKLEGAYKLSQNRDDKNFARVIDELELRKEDGSSKIASAMREIRPLK